MSRDYIDATIRMGVLRRYQLNKRRSLTDSLYLFAFAMFLILWFAIAIYAYSVGSSLLIFISDSLTNEVIDTVRFVLDKYKYVILLSIWITAWNLGFYFAIIRWLTKYVICFTFFLTGANFVALFIVVFQVGILPGIFVPFLGIIVAYFSAAFYTFKRTDMDDICKLIQDASRAMACFPSTLLIFLAQVALICVIKFFIISVLFSLISIDNHINPHINAYTIFSMIIFICCSVWMISFINTIGRMTLHGMFSTWYSTEDKKSISTTTIFKCLYTILRYHLGTAAFGSTIFTIIHKILVCYHCAKYHFAEIKNKPMMIFSYLYLFFNNTANTLVGCAVHGNGFYRSMKGSHNLIMRNPFDYIATRSISIWMLSFGMSIIPMITILLSFIYANQISDHSNPGEFLLPLIIIVWITSLMSLSLLYIFNAAIEAILFGYYSITYSDGSMENEEFYSQQSPLENQTP